MSDAAKSKQFKRIKRGEFILKKCFLDERSTAQILRIPHDSPTENMQHIAEGCRTGLFQCAEVVHNGKKVGLSIFQIIENEAGKEFLSIASIGTDRTDLTKSIIPILEEIAANYGCKSIRLHTMRPGLCSKLFPLGWFASEIVMSKEL